MKKSIIGILLILLAWSCIYKLENSPQKSGESYLSVEADFSDLSVTQAITLTYSVGNGTGVDYTRYEQNANVYITDDLGNQIVFLPSGIKGQYISNTSGTPGRTYTLHIKTTDGRSYISSAETMRLSPAIDNTYYQFEEDTKYEQSDSKRYGFNVYLDFTDPSTPDDFYQWTWAHYENATYCATCDGGRYNTSTNSCDAIKGSTTFYRFSCDGNCWDITRSNPYNLLSDAYYNGQAVKMVPISRVSYESVPTQFYLEIQQRSINKNVYLYLKSLQSQTTSNGTLFDVPAQTRFNFNINSETNPEEKILGIFNVFSAKKKIIYVDRTGPINGVDPHIVLTSDVYWNSAFPVDNIYVTCVNSLFRSNTAPEGWK